MNYLLDTNACIALINRRSSAVRSRFQKAISGGARIYVSSVVTLELWYGVAKSVRQDLNTQRLEAFLAGPIISLPLEEQDARVAGSVRAALQASGTPIGAYDLLIAGQAMRNKLTLITANVSEFARIKALAWADWGRP